MHELHEAGNVFKVIKRLGLSPAAALCLAVFVLRGGHLDVG